MKSSRSSFGDRVLNSGRSRRPQLVYVSALFALLLLTSGCATPIGVARGTTQEMHYALTANVLSRMIEPRRLALMAALDTNILVRFLVRDEAAQLVSREWIITHGDGREERVVGPGVVGQQPLLTPGQSFDYTSFCPLPTPVGSMHGSYRMVRPDGRSFEARIAPFTLAVPTALN